MAEELTAHQREDYERELASYMRALSEDAYCAQWIGGLTESLIEACEEVDRTGQAAIVGAFYVSPARRDVLMFMVNKLGYWIDHDGKPFKPKKRNNKREG